VPVIEDEVPPETVVAPVLVTTLDDVTTTS